MGATTVGILKLLLFGTIVGLSGKWLYLLQVRLTKAIKKALTAKGDQGEHIVELSVEQVKEASKTVLPHQRDH